MIGYFDIEADNLLEKAKRVHCIAIALDDNAPVLYTADKIDDALRILDSCEMIVAHNGIGYDLPLLKKLFGYVPKAKVADTLILSQLCDPDLVDGHSLDAWGERVGVLKTNYVERFIAWRSQGADDYVYKEGDEWLEYNRIMGEYCEQDVLVLRSTYAAVRSKMSEVERKCPNIKWTKAEWMEHEFGKAFAEQGIHGVYVDQEHLASFHKKLEEELSAIEEEITPLLPPKANPTVLERAKCIPPKIQFTKDGKAGALALRWFDNIREIEIDGETKLQGYKFGEWHTLPTPSDEEGNKLPLKTTHKMHLSDSAELKGWLMREGWVPSFWSYKKCADKNGKLRVQRDDKGQPIVSQPKFHDKGVLCPNLEAMHEKFPHIAKVVRWFVLRHRYGLTKGVYETLRDDGRVSASGISLGTPTARVAHTRPVCNIPKADKSVLFGKECRAIFSAPPGRVMVGVDAAGLELRCLANRVNNPDFTKLILADKDKGELDIHTFLAEQYNKHTPVTRSSGKNITYALLYGASDGKVGETAGAPVAKAEQIGSKLRDVFVNALPGVDKLMERVELAAKRGYIAALDGRRIGIRSKHAALNTLLQSDGSIIVKWATVAAVKQLSKLELDAHLAVHYHDELQLESSEQDAEQAGMVVVEAMRWAGRYFNFKLPLDGDMKIGRNWAETH